MSFAHQPPFELPDYELGPEEWIGFPDPRGRGDLVALGGSLSPGYLISAYRQGFFPWYEPGEEICWWHPNPRFVILEESLHISRSMAKLLKQKKMEITLDQAFSRVIRACGEVFRPGQGGTWVSKEIIQSYEELHRLGYAHSCEAWQDGELVGGCYGLALGKVFFGESMFSLRPNSSKAAFLTLAQGLFARGFVMIDAQIHTPHLESLGGVFLRRQDFSAILRRWASKPDFKGSWSRGILQAEFQPS